MFDSVSSVCIDIHEAATQAIAILTNRIRTRGNFSDTLKAFFKPETHSRPERNIAKRLDVGTPHRGEELDFAVTSPKTACLGDHCNLVAPLSVKL